MLISVTVLMLNFIGKTKGGAFISEQGRTNIRKLISVKALL